MKRALVVLAFACTMLVAASADDGSAKGKTTVVFWNGYTGPDRPVLEQIVANFNKESTTVEIKMEIMPWDTLFQKLMPALIAKNGPDMIAMSAGRYAEYAEAGQLFDVGDFLKKSPDLDTKLLVPGLFSAGNYHGKQYAMPMGFAAMVMYFNKDQFKAAGLNPDAPPKTLAELQKAWEKLAAKGAAAKQYAQAIGVKATVPMVPVFMWMYGAEVLKNGKSALDSPEALASMEMLAAAYKKGVSPVGLTGQEADNLFAAGKASIEFNGPWAINGFKNAGINLGIAEVPTGPKGHKTWGGDTVLSITANSAVKEAAWEFIKYWNSVPVQRKWALEVGFPPTRIDMATDKALLAGNPAIVTFLKSASYAEIFLPSEPKAGRIDAEVLVPLFEAVTRGTETPKAALQKAHAALNALMAE